jgi:hypothetical protein
MADMIYANGTLELTVPAGSEIALYSRDAAKIYQKVGYPNMPPSWNLLNTITGGTEWVSTTLAATGAVVRVDAGPSDVHYEVATTPSIWEPQGNIELTAANAQINPVTAATGGNMTMRGRTATGAAAAGGTANVLGGTPGAGGIGGAATLTGGAGNGAAAGGAATLAGGLGGATNAAGGVASLTGGAGQGTGAGANATVTGGASGGGATGNGGIGSVAGGAAMSTNGAGGAANVTGGAGRGTGAGGAAALAGGASGTGATGNGGAAAVTGGAAGSTNGNGGNITLTVGAKAGTGMNGIVRNVGAVAFKALAAAAATVADAATPTEAQILGGVIYQDASGGAVGFNMPAIATFLSYFPDLAVGEGVFLRVASNHGANTATITAGAGYTAYGSLASINTGATYLIVRTAAATADIFRVG